MQDLASDLNLAAKDRKYALPAPVVRTCDGSSLEGTHSPMHTPNIGTLPAK